MTRNTKAAVQEKLAIMEEKVSELTLELKTSKKKISELEKTLLLANKSLVEQVMARIQNYQGQLIYLVNRKISPAVEQTQDTLDKIQQIIFECKYVIQGLLTDMNTNIQRRYENIHQWPVIMKEQWQHKVVDKATKKVEGLMAYCKNVDGKSKGQTLVFIENVYSTILRWIESIMNVIKKIKPSYFSTLKNKNVEAAHA